MFQVVIIIMLMEQQTPSTIPIKQIDLKIVLTENLEELDGLNYLIQVV